jgi:AsmA protein
MKKLLKITAIGFAVLLILIVALSLFVKSYLTEERIRALVSEAAEKSINRKVALGEIDISLFKGIVVKDFEIREKDSDSAFLKANEFVLMYQFFPLLTKKLVIDKLSIEDVEINLQTNPDGTYNFSDMVKKDNPDEPKEEKPKAEGLPIDLNVKNIAIKNAKIHYVDALGKLKKADVIMSAELKIMGLSKNAISSQGSIETTIAEALLKDGNKVFKDIQTSAQYKIDVDMEKKLITVHSIELDLMKIPATIVGDINYDSGTAYSLVVKIPGYNLSQIKSDIAAAFLPKGMALGGNVSALLNVNKKKDKESPINFDGTVKMAKVSCAYKNMNLVLDGAVKLTPDIISLEGLTLVAGANSAGISGLVRNYKEYPDVNITIKSKYIALDDLIVMAPPSGKSEQEAKGDETRKEREPMNLKLRVNASLDIDKTVYKGISINNFTSRYELKNNVFNIPYLKGKTLSGAFSLKASVNLAQKGTAYNMNADLNGVKLEEIVNAFAPKAKDKLFGILSGKASINGAGTTPANVKRNLKGNGEFAIKEGTIKNAEISSGLLAILGLQELKEIKMDKADGTFSISNEVVNLTTVINNKDLSIDETGTIGLDQKLNLSILAKVSDRLAPKLISQSSIAQFLSSEKGWTSLPLKVGGTLSKPAYGVDTKVVGKKLTESLKKKAGEELQNILLKDKNKTTGTEKQKSSSPAERILDIFGK